MALSCRSHCRLRSHANMAAWPVQPQFRRELQTIHRGLPTRFGAIDIGSRRSDSYKSTLSHQRVYFVRKHSASNVLPFASDTHIVTSIQTLCIKRVGQVHRSHHTECCLHWSLKKHRNFTWKRIQCTHKGSVNRPKVPTALRKDRPLPDAASQKHAQKYSTVWNDQGRL